MQPAQIEKLKALIQISPVLTAQERAEWTALLELMNDKQLGELEKILSSNQQAVSRTQNTEHRAQSTEHKTQSIEQKNGLKQDATAGLPKAGTQMPQLSHIMNLPRINVQENQQVHQPNLTKVPPVVSPHVSEQTIKAKQSSGFASKLKAIFAEKELTTSKPEFPLELTEGSKTPKVENNLAKSAVASEKPPTIISLDEILKLTPVVPKQAPSVPIPPPIAPPKRIPKLPLAQNLPIEPNIVKSEPGLNFPKITDRMRVDNLATIKEHVESQSLHVEPQPLVEPVAPIKPHSGKPLALEKLEDLEQFSYRMLEESDFNAVVKKFLQLKDKYGYFDVIMSLEKSPAYKIYISTGFKLLSEQISFEQLAEKPKSEPYFERSEFEKFSDLLSKIQTA